MVDDVTGQRDVATRQFRVRNFGRLEMSMSGILFRPRWCLRYSQIERIRNRGKPIYSNSQPLPSSISNPLNPTILLVLSQGTTNPAHQGISLVTKKIDQEEKQDFCIVNLYHLVDIPDPEHVS